MSTLIHKLHETRRIIDQEIDRFLILPNDLTNRVIEAMRYSAIGSGKALRPFLVLTVGKILNLPISQAIAIGTALEMVHVYSLIHDDLPAMDNDTLRRGKPTTHVQFDEATAILAGDALLTKAFEILSRPESLPDPTIRCKLIFELSVAAGTQGMIGGQMMDLIGEKMPLNKSQIEQMQSLKTGALLKYACLAPAYATHSSENVLKALSQYADSIGLLFQITDDLLDVEGSPEIVGKTLHKDGCKSTFISTLGIQKTKELASHLAKTARENLSLFKDQAHNLEEIIQFILSRKK